MAEMRPSAAVVDDLLECDGIHGLSSPDAVAVIARDRKVNRRFVLEAVVKMLDEKKLSTAANYVKALLKPSEPK